MKISLLVPCFNEERSIEATIRSCLNQTRKFDEIIFIDDSSTDDTPNILKRYARKGVKSYKTPHNTGNKSSAQEFGLNFLTGDIMVTTDADTLLDPRFVEEIEKSFRNPGIFAVAGYVKSLPYNWLTLCRAFDYVIGQDFHKLAQAHLNYIFVMPGAASAFRVKMFRRYITFDHDTITEDLDFTYMLHRRNLRIEYNTKAITYTQDPATLSNYINQMRRWYDGGWQNLRKHYRIMKNPVRALELSLIYIEGMVFSVLIFLIPLLNFWFALMFIFSSLIITLLYGIWAAWRQRRPLLLLAPFPYVIIVFINSALYLETFTKEILLRRRNLKWFKPERVNIEIKQ
ncbi:MAG: glycosyltransferase [Bacillota bacterium]